jgi:hypothetical protein
MFVVDMMDEDDDQEQKRINEGQFDRVLFS